jgi:hypothetical protein
MFHEEAAKGAPSLGIRGERLTQTLQPGQLWNHHSDRQPIPTGRQPGPLTEVLGPCARQAGNAIGTPAFDRF